MSARNDGGPAFPVDHTEALVAGDGGTHGMTLRDAAAFAALPAIISVTSAGLHNSVRGSNDHRSVHQRIADDAYQMADAMLAARERGDA